MGRPVLLRHDASLAFEQQLAARGSALEHPERADRIIAIDAELARRDWLGYARAEAPLVDERALVAVHGHDYVERIRAAAAVAGGTQFGEDTTVSEASLAAALRAAGGACALAEALLSGDSPTGMSVARPPGHHADTTVPQGFCLFNSVAVAAQHALDALGARRVLVVDWDVHHGNGTNDVFRRSDRVLFASIHQAGLFPGTGALTDVGAGPGTGYSLNLPVGPGTDGEVWRSLLEHVVVPVAELFAPDLVLISAGFDALADDPSADTRLDVEDFAAMACLLRDLGAPVGAVLEGGYRPSLAAAVAATMAALGGAGDTDWVAADPIYTRRGASFIGHYWQL